LRFQSDAAPGRLAPRELDLARTELAAGDPDRAVELCDAVDERLAASLPGTSQRLEAAALRGLARLAQGDRAAAQAALERLDGAGGELDTDLDLDRAELLVGIGAEDRAAAALRAVLADPKTDGLELERITAEFRAATLEASRHPGVAATARLDAARRRARDAKLGSLLGEKL
jgi:hypothetical protein